MSDADTSTNGASTNEGAVSSAAQFAADKAAFIAMADGAEDKHAAKSKAAPAEDAEKSEPADDADPDADLDDENDAEKVGAKADEDDDPDADLDDEDEKPAKVDPDTAKKLDNVRRTDKRLREQREREWAAKEREFEQREADLKPKLERLEKFERLAARVRYEPEAVLLELGASEDDLDLATKRLYALSKAGKADPKVREAVDRLSKERERDEELRSMKKRLEERDEAEKKSREEAEQRRHIDAHVDRFAKAASDRYPLAKAYIAAKPEAARSRIEVIAGKLIQETGRMPEPKDVMKALEKNRRASARAMGFDPKAIAKSPAAKTDEKKAAPKSPEKPSPKAKADDSKPLTKDDFINGRYD